MNLHPVVMMNRELGWWALAAMFFILGDVTTTVIGISIGFGESHPLADLLMGQFGVVSTMLLGKVLLMVFAIGITYHPRTRPDVAPEAIPAALAVWGLLATAWNLVVIA